VSDKIASEKKFTPQNMRTEPRVPGLRHITVSYEGRDEEIRVKPPDLSVHGMFISTTRSFPEGAILNLQFQLAHTGFEVAARAEVRYCLPGVGVGVEFIEVSTEAQQEIAREVNCQTQGRGRATKYSEDVLGRRSGRSRRLRRKPSGQ
jgi:hypothetical protein